jgi:hypothetical protein
MAPYLLDRRLSRWAAKIQGGHLMPSISCNRPVQVMPSDVNQRKVPFVPTLATPELRR